MILIRLLNNFLFSYGLGMPAVNDVILSFQSTVRQKTADLLESTSSGNGKTRESFVNENFGTSLLSSSKSNSMLVQANESERILYDVLLPSTTGPKRTKNVPGMLSYLKL